MLGEKKNDFKRKPLDRRDPFKKSEALEVLIIERNILLFISELNKKSDNEVFITEVGLFEFRKYIQEKKDSLDKNLFEK